jgi:SAM-dependent methyltransferase
MAHREQREFFDSVKEVFHEHFRDSKVLDVGSLDINGNNRYLFENSAYIGLDIASGKNVDIVSPAHLSGFPSGYFDTIISGECFEHDLYFEDTIETIIRVLRKGGLFVMTCAGKNRQEHGTSKVDPESSPFTNDFYQNRTAEDFQKIPEFSQMKGYFVEARNGMDLYYAGVKQ